MNEHPIVTGILLLAIGALGIAGSVTGNLAPMIAALFDPSDLTSSPTASGSSKTTPLVDSGNVLDVGSTASPSGNATTATPGLKGGFTAVPPSQIP